MGKLIKEALHKRQVKVIQSRCCFLSKWEDGIVLVASDKCVGCQSCVVACPYGGQDSIEGSEGYSSGELTPYEKMGQVRRRPGVVEKCTLPPTT